MAEDVRADGMRQNIFPQKTGRTFSLAADETKWEWFSLRFFGDEKKRSVNFRG